MSIAVSAMFSADAWDNARSSGTHHRGQFPAECLEHARRGRAGAGRTARTASFDTIPERLVHGRQGDGDPRRHRYHHQALCCALPGDRTMDRRHRHGARPCGNTARTGRSCSDYPSVSGRPRHAWSRLGRIAGRICELDHTHPLEIRARPVQPPIRPISIPDQTKCMPASTSKVSPVTWRLASVARNRAASAMSSGPDATPSGVFARIEASSPS